VQKSKIVANKTKVTGRAYASFMSKGQGHQTSKTYGK